MRLARSGGNVAEDVRPIIGLCAQLCLKQATPPRYQLAVSVLTAER